MMQKISYNTILKKAFKKNVIKICFNTGIYFSIKIKFIMEKFLSVLVVQINVDRATSAVDAKIQLKWCYEIPNFSF